MRLLTHGPLFLALIAAVIFSVGLLPQLPSWRVVAILAAITLLLLYRRYWRLAILIAAAIYSITYGKYLLVSQLPPQLDNQFVHVVGVVDGLPEHDERKQRFLFRVDALYSSDDHQLLHRADGLVRLSWYRPASHKHASVEPGQRWRLVVKLRRPRGFVNPAGFDYQVYLMSRGIIATGYVKSSVSNTLLMDDDDLLDIDHWRSQIKNQFLQWGQRQQITGLLLALAIGERSLINADQWALLRNTGTIHLMAISGLHISLAAIVGFWLGLFGSRLWQLFFPVSVVSYSFPAICSMAIALVYGLLAGMSLPTQRALIMVLIFHLARLLYRNPGPWLLLSIALLIIAIHDPLATYNQGFWLSFLAVAVLLYGFIGRLGLTVRDSVVEDTVNIAGIAGIESIESTTHSDKYFLRLKQLWISVMRYLKALCWSQWIVALGLLIPSLVWLQGVSASAPVANSIAVPYISILIVPLLLLTMMLGWLAPTIAADVYRFTETALAGLMELLQLIDQHFPDFVRLPVGELPWIPLLLASVAVIWLLAPRGVPCRYLGIFLLLPIIFPGRETSPLSITFLEVGQGTAVVIETRNHVLVYDAGPYFGPRFNAGAHIIAPYLRYRGYTGIDHLMVSHADKDHAGGLHGLIESMPIARISSGEVLPINQSVSACQRGNKWQWDDVNFTVLWPVAIAPLGNNASCVLLIEYDDKYIILPGDIEDEVEQAMLTTDFLPRDVDITMAPHHGSQSSSSPAWVERLSPQWVVVTAGYKNRYGHPHPGVVDRYLKQGSTLLNTANQGAIQFIVDRDKDWRIVTWRQYHRRYWYEH